MAVKIRLQRHGKKKAPLYTIVVASSRAPRDGKFIERLGTYDPTTIPALIEINNDKALDWINKGAQPTDTVKAILRYKGVMFKKHLDRGVKKGALTAEAAEKLYNDFLENRNDQVRKKKEEHLNKLKKSKESLIAGEVKKREAMEAARKPVVEEVVAEETPAEAAVETAEAPVVETTETPTAEATETPASEVAETPAPSESDGTPEEPKA